uniref:TRPM SLOG domain-containing protein n=1 Tax=Laticauda laticaudata TaxID=8630 RepID=A0A8C5SWV2_LATLA
MLLLLSLFTEKTPALCAWIFTSGLHVGITKHIGQAVQDHMLTSTSSTVKVVAIGITSLEKIQKCNALGTWPLYSLDNHHSHFILVEESEPDGITKLQLSLEKYISEQRTNYGGKTKKKKTRKARIFKGLKNSIPCLILAGSGGIADILAALMSEPHLIVPEVVQKQLKQKFPTENFTSNETDNWTEMEAQEYLDELKLAVAWNRVDIAKSEIFSGDVEWKSCDLEEVLMDALVNDKPEFVKLFIDNGANIYDFLTYSRLQTLYCNISSKSLLHKLLFKKHNKEDIFTLHEVSRVLKDFLHDTNARKFSSLDMNQKSENPWRDLFLWAVLQNRHEMAHLFWAMVSFKKQTIQPFPSVCMFLVECYHDSEEQAFNLLVRKNRYWSKTTCLHLATEADAKSFFAHDGVQVSTLQGIPLLKVLDNPQFRKKRREHCYACTVVGSNIFLLPVLWVWLGGHGRGRIL